MNTPTKEMHIPQIAVFPCSVKTLAVILGRAEGQLHTQWNRKLSKEHYEHYTMTQENI